ncbi:MAG: hypothetical protein HY026_08150 [Deltaproteobacteria bacterium]|nr:hypothetical protein [Deltaproteobacteria bacterium]
MRKRIKELFGEAKEFRGLRAAKFRRHTNEGMQLFALVAAPFMGVLFTIPVYKFITNW